MSKFTLSNEYKAAPFRLFFYAVEKFGKSTFAAAAPKPVFISLDDGLGEVKDPEGNSPTRALIEGEPPKSFDEVMAFLDWLIEEQHDRQTLVVDPLNWLEKLIFAEYIRRNPLNEKREKVKEINDYGFFKGQSGSVDIWRLFIAKLDRIRAIKNMNIILLCHSKVGTFKNPEGPDFDRYSPMLDERGANVLKQWCDAIVFGNYEILTFKGQTDRKAKGVGKNTRILHTERCDAYDAGTRYPLPARLPLNFDEFYSYISGARNAEVLDSLRKQIAETVVGTEIETSALQALDQHINNPQKLKELLTYVSARLGRKASEENE